MQLGPRPATAVGMCYVSFLCVEYMYHDHVPALPSPVFQRRNERLLSTSYNSNTIKYNTIVVAAKTDRRSQRGKTKCVKLYIIEE